MSTLSQFSGSAGGGLSYVGEIIVGNYKVLGNNPTIGTKEYLQTGCLKDYTSTYSAIGGIKELNAVRPVAANAGWRQTLANNFLTPNKNRFYKIEKAGDNLHFISLAVFGTSGSGSQEYANNYGNTIIYFGANTQVTPEGNTTSPGNIRVVIDSVTINNRVLIQTQNTLSTCSNIYFANSNTYSLITNWSNYGQYSQYGGAFLLSNTNFVTAVPLTITNQNGNMATSTDGLSWTARTPNNTFLLYPRYGGWNPASNAFFLLSTNVSAVSILSGGTTTRFNVAIHTTTDGAGLTLRTLPADMPLTVFAYTYANNINSLYSANSQTCGLVSIGDGKLLKAGSSNTFTIIDLTTKVIGNTNPYTDVSQPFILYDGTQFILASNEPSYPLPVFCTSTDDGDTWTRRYCAFDASNPNMTWLNGISYANSKLYIMLSDVKANSNTMATLPFEFTSNLTSSTPTYIGSPEYVSVDAGTGMTPYIRVL